MLQASKKFIAELNAFRMIIGSIILALPVMGANISSFVSWSGLVWNLEAELSDKITKDDSMEIILYIEDALFDDLTYAKLEIQQVNADETLDDELKAALLEGHFEVYNHTILKLERIRDKIRSLDPEWKSREEIEDEKGNK